MLQSYELGKIYKYRILCFQIPCFSMTSSRHSIEDKVWDYLIQVNRKLGYNLKGELSKDVMVMKLLKFADRPENYKLFCAKLVEESLTQSKHE